MQRRTRIAVGALAVAVALGAGAGAAASAVSGGDDDEAPITGDALTRAEAAALAHIPGGRVTDTEVGDEESLYEVEVTLDDGRQVDVQLDERFRVVGSEGEDAAEDDD